MRFGTALIGGKAAAIVAGDHGWHAIGQLVEGAPTDLLGVIAAGETLLARISDALRRGAAHPLDPAAMTLLAPIPRPAKNVFCLGRNYREHIAEDNRTRDLDTDVPKYPQFFTKPPTAVVGPGADVRLDEKVTRRLDYEVELAVVIGRAGRDIAAEAAEEHIFGYAICNDVTARELQAKHGQWFKGKALDTSFPFGPFILHRSALPLERAQRLRIGLSVNGEQRQDASTADMIFDIPAQIASLSAGLTLEPGDIIATGTPSGVGYAMDPRQYLKAGDVMECRIEELGTLTNPVVAA